MVTETDGALTWAATLARARRERDDFATRTLGGIFLTDGTKVLSMEQGAALLAAYDELIAALKRRAEMAEADPTTELLLLGSIPIADSDAPPIQDRGMERSEDLPSGWTRVPGYERLPMDEQTLRIRRVTHHQGRIWVLASVQESGTREDSPPRTSTRVGPSLLFGLGFAVLWLDVKAILQRSTSSLRAIWLRAVAALTNRQ